MVDDLRLVRVIYKVQLVFNIILFKNLLKLSLLGSLNLMLNLCKKCYLQLNLDKQS